MSGQTSTGLDQPPGFDGDDLSDEDIESIREAEAEHHLKPVGSDGSPELSLDKKFELLKNQRRRWVLRYLIQNGEKSTTGDLAEHVAVLENDKDGVNELTSKERKAAYVGLYQCHLPKMDDYGILQFNQARGRIELTERAYELQEYLDRETEPRWPLRYLGIALTGGLLFTATSVVGAAVLPPVVAGATIVGVMAIAAWQWWGGRPE